jgi:Ser/Thr protein kinase RdoA (MazF antagonist)
LLKLSRMKAIMDQVKEDWTCPLAEKILEKWGFDPGSVYFFRASANSVFIFRKEGQRYFLRLSHTEDRAYQTLEKEVQVLLFLKDEPNVSVTEPVISNDNQYIERIETELGSFFAVVFKGLEGEMFEIEDLDENQFVTWGRTLGELHQALKGLPKETTDGRPGFTAHLETVRQALPTHETSALKELERLCRWAEGLPSDPDHFGLIHYDFELDNLVWREETLGVLDFDDAANYWYAADIAYALRDLFEEKVDLDSPSFKAFMSGYTEVVTPDVALLNQLEGFLKWHNLRSFTEFLQVVDLDVTEEDPEWLVNLHGKLIAKLETYRQSFEVHSQI